MEKFSKKTLLNYVNGAGLFGAAPSGSSVVKFAWASTLNKIGTGGDGTITFYADTTNGSGLVLVGDQVVSSKIMDLAWAQSTASGAKTGEKVVTLKYISGLGENAVLNTVTLDVIDKVAAKAIIEDYFATSNTIDVSNGVANVRVDGTTVLVDSTKGLKSGLNIAYVAGSASTEDDDNDRIALRDANNNELSHIDIQDIIGGGIVDHTSYNPANNTLTIYWKGDAEPTVIDLSAVFDISDWDVKSDSTDFLSLTIDASTAEIGVKKADVTFTAASGANPANLTVNTTAGEILVASDAIPAIKSYVDAQQADNGIAVESKNAYIDASIDANNNKKINLAAQTADLTVAKVGDADTTIAGTSGKLIDAADAATKTTSFVNARIAEEIGKLDGDVTSDDETYVTVEVKTAGGEVDDVIVTQTKSTITASASALSATAGIADGSEFATGVKIYVDGQINALDSELDITSADGSLNFDASVVDGKIVEGHIDYVKSTVAFTAKDGNTPANLTGTAGFLTGGDIATIKSYVDAVSGALDSSVTDTDNFVTVKTTQENGALTAQDVTVVTADISAGPGAIDVQSDGLVTGTTLETAIENSLKWITL